MKYTNHHDLPQSLVDAIVGDYDISKADPKRVGITTLINPPRPRLLQVAHWDELEEDVSDHLWRITGSAYHYILAKIDDNKEVHKRTRLLEEKITEELDGITIVGILDLYDEILKSIEDYKITSIWSITFGDHKDWENQLNCYVWLLRKKGYEVKEAYVNAILRDWRKGELLRYGKDYPKIPFKRVKINLWTHEEQEVYVKERVAIYKAQLELPLEEVPICDSKARWAKEDKYAIYKNKNKTAARVLDCAKKADEWIGAKKEDGHTYRINIRKGEDIKCINYCIANRFCKYWLEKYGSV